MKAFLSSLHTLAIVTATALFTATSAMADIDYTKKYACQAERTEVSVINGSMGNREPVESFATTIGFEVESDFVFVTTTDIAEEIGSGKKSEVELRSYVLPNAQACDKMFDNKQMVLNLHAIATGFQSARCEKAKLSAEYYLSGPFGGQHTSVEMEALRDQLDVVATSVSFENDSEVKIETIKYECKIVNQI